MKSIRILIVGGGYAGVKAAKLLHKLYKREKRVELTLVDRNRFHTLMTELHEVAGDRVPQASVKISYDRIFSGKRVRVVNDEIVDLDIEGQLAQGKTGEYPWDFILLAFGGAPADFNITGVRDHTLSLWSLDDALWIRRHLEITFRRAALERDPQKRRELMTVVVAGGGFTGVELVGELVEYLPVLCKKYDLPTKDIRLVNLEALGQVLGMLPEKSQAKAVAFMEKKGVEVRTNALIVRADEDSFTLRDGSVIKAGTKVWTCGVKGNCFAACDELKEGKAGRKEVNLFMRSPGLDNVYLAGDAVWFIEDGKPIPQIVEAAEQSAEVAAHNIAVSVDAELSLKRGLKEKQFHGQYHGYMVSIGSKYAVSYTGKLSLTGFFAMALKHFVNMYYQFTVAGMNAAWTYLKHEILDIRHGRSLIGSFVQWKVPSYWLLPLRVFLGVQWLLQGIHKIEEGWLDRSRDFVSVATSAGDAVSGATEVVADTATTATVGVETAAAYGAGLLDKPMDIYVWVAERTVNQAPFFFQSGIVIFEVLLGLALIGGAFTWLSAAASFVFSIMLIIGGMTDSSILWYMAAALAMMGGAGKAFGLDYWIMPFIKRWWNGTALARKTYFYVDEPTLRKKK